MKLENCLTFAPVFDYCNVMVANYTVEDNYECVIKQNTDDAFYKGGSDGKTSPTVYKHSINVCTYGDSPAYACGEY